MKIDKLKEFVLLLISVILVIFLIKYLDIFKYLKIILTILFPLFIGFIYAWIFNPLIVSLSRKLSRNWSCILLFLFIIGFFILFLYFLVPMFYREISELIEILPNYFKRIEVKVEAIGFKEYLDKIISFIINSISNNLISLVGNLFKYVGVILVGLILGLYISIDYERIVETIYKIIPDKYECVLIKLLNEISYTVRKCVNGICLIASFVFIIDSICFVLIGLDSAFLLGFICGITDLIPYIGPYIGGVVAVLVGFTESKFLGILTLLVVFVVQCIENYVLQPIIMSKSIKISPILVMVGLLIFGNLFGIVGMIFATPILAILKVLFVKFNIILKKCKRET